ncbi:hypothetical protein APTSU1_000302600 [Apodemus speciosus]|uniref:Uncharacterized protein n=1 Tax=Apodemus speciosus TaxID=105296 RepID=A0ABQ0ELA1_APOSI
MDLGKVDLGKVYVLVVDKVVLSLDSQEVDISINLSLVTVMAQVSIPALVSMVLNMVSLPILVSIALITASLLALAPVIQGLTSLPNSADMALVQGSLLVWINMDQQQDKILDPPHRVLDNVIPLGLDTMVHPQESLQAVGQVSPPLMVNRVQDCGSHLRPGEEGLPQGESSTSQQYGSSSRESSGFSQHGSGQGGSGQGGSGQGGSSHSGQRGSFSGQSQGSHQHGSGCGHLLVMVKKNMAQVSLPALAQVTQGHASLPNSGGMALVQDSLLVWINMDPQQDKILDPLHRVLDNVIPLGPDSMVHPQDSLQAVGQVSPPPMVNKVQDCGSHLRPGEAGLPQGSLLHLNSIGLAQENLLALVNMDLGKVDLSKVDLLIVDKEVLSLDSHKAVSSMGLVVVSLLVMVKKNMAQVSLPALAQVTQGHASLLNSGDMVLVQDILLVWINMDQHQDKILDPPHRVLDKVIPLGLDTMVHPQESLQAVD